MLETFESQDAWDSAGPYTAYRVTPKGMSWLFANQGMLTLKRDKEDVPF
jgi:hypothetical protein